jgi:WD40 repeat protein
VAFVPGGSAIASAAGNLEDFDVRLWGLRTGATVGGLTGHTGIIWQLAFSPDGQLLVSVSKDKTARIWDWRRGTQVQMLSFADQVTSVAFSPDGKTLAVGGVDGFPNAAVWTYATDTWQPVLKLQEFWNIPEIAWSPNGQYILAGGTSRNARIWRADGGEQLAVLSHSGQVSSVAISPEGTLGATAGCQASDAAHQCTTGGVWIWNVPAGTLARQLSQPGGWVEDVAFSPDGSLLIAGSRDGWLRAYSTSDFGLIFEQWTAGGIQDIAISAEGRLLATGRSDGRVDLWEVSSQVP